MSESEVKAAFAAIDPQHPFYLAVLQVLGDGILAEQDNVTIPNLTDSSRQFNAGRLAHAKDILADMGNLMTRSHADQLTADLKS